MEEDSECYSWSPSPHPMKNFPICNVRQVEGAVCPILDIHGFTIGRLAAGYISQSIGSWTIRATATPSRLAPCVRHPCDNRCRFSLSLYLDKTRLIELDRFAADPRARRGLGKPETFNAPGFAFTCERNSQGKFFILRKTRRDRMRAKLKAIKEELRRRMHEPIPKQGAWLQQVVRGPRSVVLLESCVARVTGQPQVRGGLPEIRLVFSVV
jgi:hypothetical protein